MPDTGAPWNIPYVENADLVRDWPADSLLVANAVAAGLSAAGNAGIGSNVVQTVKTDTFSTSSTSYTAVTGLSSTITPTSASSKVLVIVNFTFSTSAVTNPAAALFRGATNVGGGASVGSRLSAIANLTLESNYRSTQAFHFLDSPASTSATTYAVHVATGTGTLYIGLSASDSDSSSSDNVRTSSTITAIEVAA